MCLLVAFMLYYYVVFPVLYVFCVLVLVSFLFAYSLLLFCIIFFDVCVYVLLSIYLVCFSMSGSDLFCWCAVVCCS